MAISVGSKVPSATLQKKTAEGVQQVSTDDLFKGKKVVVFAVPGAFTPTCSAKHLPGYVQNAAALKGKGVDTVACISVNDAFVMEAWGKDQKAEGKVEMLADGSAAFTKALGLDLDLTSRGMGVRAKRFAMVVEDGTVKQLLVEPNPGELVESSAENVLSKL
ncbi:MAG: peroxiredoxin [Alphaproteobacteria bacterium]